MIHITKPSKELLDALAKAGALPESSAEGSVEGSVEVPVKSDMVQQLADQVGVPVEMVAAVLETMLKTTKEPGASGAAPAPAPAGQPDDLPEIAVAAGFDPITAWVAFSPRGSGCTGHAFLTIVGWLSLIIGAVWQLARWVR